MINTKIGVKIKNVNICTLFYANMELIVVANKIANLFIYNLQNNVIEAMVVSKYFMVVFFLMTNKFQIQIIVIYRAIAVVEVATLILYQIFRS